MSYSSPARFRLLGLPAGALEGVGDDAIQEALDDAFAEINEALSGRNVTVPVETPEGALASLGAIEIRIARLELLTGYIGTPPDDPGVAGAVASAKRAWERLDGIAAGLLNTGAAKAAGGGGMVGAFGAVDVFGDPEPDWYP